MRVNRSASYTSTRESYDSSQYRMVVAKHRMRVRFLPYDSKNGGNAPPKKVSRSGHHAALTVIVISPLKINSTHPSLRMITRETRRFHACSSQSSRFSFPFRAVLQVKDQLVRIYRCNVVHCTSERCFVKTVPAEHVRSNSHQDSTS